MKFKVATVHTIEFNDGEKGLAIKPSIRTRLLGERIILSESAIKCLIENEETKE